MTGATQSMVDSCNKLSYEELSPVVIDYLSALPEVDRSCLTLLGFSGGQPSQYMWRCRITGYYLL